MGYTGFTISELNLSYNYYRMYYYYDTIANFYFIIETNAINHFSSLVFCD